MSGTASVLCLHATTIAYAGKAAILRGPSGSGKSGLALQVIAMGASLVADDKTLVTRKGDALIAAAPEPILGQIEARGVGIFTAPLSPPATVGFIVDMVPPSELKRLPEYEEEPVLGLPLPLLRNTDAPYFPAAVLLYLKGKRIA